MSTHVSLAMIGDDLPWTPTRYEMAQKHRQAITRVLQQRGGLATVEKSVALNHMVQSDLKLAAATLSRPLLPFEPRFEANPYHIRIAREAERRTQAMMQTLPEQCRTMTVRGIMEHLQCMSLAYNEEYALFVDPANALNPLYQALHPLYHAFNDIEDGGENTSNRFDPLRATLLAAGLFAWCCTPDRFPEAFHSPLVHNIKVGHLNELWKVLSQTEGLYLAWTESGASLDSLLWTVYLGLSVSIEVAKSGTKGCQPTYDCRWCLDLLSQVKQKMGIETSECLSNRLGVFPLTRMRSNDGVERLDFEFTLEDIWG